MNSICDRLKQERNRLKFNQEDFAAEAGVTRRPYAEWEAGNTSPTAVQLAALAAAGADVQYIVTGIRKGEGIGQPAVHQAVLDAVDLLSLEKKVDAQQLAKAVVKLCQSALSDAVQGAATTMLERVKNQININTGVNHGTVAKKVVNKGEKK